jgi:hypothetical protein
MRLVRLALPLVAVAGLAACGDPVPPTPQAAYFVNFSDPGATCPQNSHQSELGVVDAKTRTGLVVDGTNDTQVRCTVSGSGSFAVDARATRADSLTISIPSISASATQAAPATGKVGYSSAETAGNQYAPPTDMPCQFYFQPGTPQSVAAGKLWVTFQCPQVIDGNGNQCRITESVALFENCTQ